jgi:hypothetical protein
VSEKVAKLVPGGECGRRQSNLLEAPFIAYPWRTHVVETALGECKGAHHFRGGPARHASEVKEDLHNE